jgi:hypothetical protein
MNPNCLTIGIELTINVPNPTAVVAEQMREGLANHRTASLMADIFSLTDW